MKTMMNLFAKDPPRPLKIAPDLITSDFSESGIENLQAVFCKDDDQYPSGAFSKNR